PTSLHQVLSADPRAWAEARTAARPGDQILLVGDGVALLLAPPDDGLDGALALAVDVAARGLVDAGEHAGVECIDDAAWVALVAEHAHVLSWS
ncbi:MAG: DsrH/TusB family sulfur metabolism protein, partial [Xanthomonadales bacterium]|nr:DsrH/TusB family sulfur metabolism protein [Xanthomonadales bacterium]